MDFDPRWSDDPRDLDDRDRELSRGSRGGLSNPRDRERLEPRDVFTRDLDLPRAPSANVSGRETATSGCAVRRFARSPPSAPSASSLPAIYVTARTARLTRIAATCGTCEIRGLVETIPTSGDDRALVVLTERGRYVLERNRWSNVQRELQRSAGGELRFDDGREVEDERQRPQERKREQEFYAGVRSSRHTRFAVHTPGELTHDSQVYRAYLKEADRLREDNALIRRVLLDHELKREYQQFLQERNRGKSDSDGRPDRTPEEIHRWALEHELPEHDGHVQFPDVRIEYEDRDGRLRTLDIEVETLHYRGGHAVSKAASGFSRHSISTARVIGCRGTGGGGGRRGSSGLGLSVSTNRGKGGRAPDPRIIDELLR